MQSESEAEVFLLKTNNRASGIRTLLKELPLDDYEHKSVVLKANYNSADPFPASTHPHTLEAIVKVLKSVDVDSITLAERSGMGVTRRVLEEMGVFELSERLRFNIMVIDDLAKAEWAKVGPEGTHWLKGFCIAKCFLKANKVVQTCCLKTHRFGGHFTLSLKNSVGVIARKVPGEVYDYMSELHTSPFQRQMIAEINKHYTVDLVVMDGIRAFVSGGPESGEVAEPNLLLASTDRVAIDAVGVAILKAYGAAGKVSGGRIFELDQLRRAADLGIGVSSIEEIRLIPLNNDCLNDVEKINVVFAADG